MNQDLNHWGIDFMNQVDAKVQEPGNKILESWMAGDFDECYEWLKETYPELTEEQLTWIEEFLSEI